jgi:hypothetical protein
MAQSGQAANSALPEWLNFQALPVGLFATVALSNLTPQNNNLQVNSRTAFIPKTEVKAQTGLSEYLLHMSITEPDKFKGPLSILRTRVNLPRSEYHEVILVRKEGTSALVGCFLFDFVPSSQSQDAPALASSSSNQGSIPVRLVFQRVYPSSADVKASHWYHCLYAALFQRFLVQGDSLPCHLLSATLLPEIRKAPGSVRS